MIRFTPFQMPRSAFCRLSCVLLLTTAVTSVGCGPSAPPRPQEEIQSSAAAHEQISKDMAKKYKGGPGGGHAGK
jgi:hypothetical protein